MTRREALIMSANGRHPAFDEPLGLVLVAFVGSTSWPPHEVLVGRRCFPVASSCSRRRWPFATSPCS
ncbi:MAG: hypothetical protein R2710_23650 [Acidimicrobiales bacterium]